MAFSFFFAVLLFVVSRVFLTRSLKEVHLYLFFENYLIKYIPSRAAWGSIRTKLGKKVKVELIIKTLDTYILDKCLKGATVNARLR